MLAATGGQDLAVLVGTRLQRGLASLRGQHERCLHDREVSKGVNFSEGKPLSESDPNAWGWRCHRVREVAAGGRPHQRAAPQGGEP